MINELPTIYEVVNGKNNVRTSGTNNHSNKSKSNPKVQKASESQPKQHTKPMPQPKEEDDDEGLEEEGDDGGEDGEDEHGETLCGACGDNYASDEFWICCDVCEKWFHGKCVKITPARAEHIKQYKCPACSTSNKRARPS